MRLSAELADQIAARYGKDALSPDGLLELEGPWPSRTPELWELAACGLSRSELRFLRGRARGGLPENATAMVGQTATSVAVSSPDDAQRILDELALARGIRKWLEPLGLFSYPGFEHTLLVLDEAHGDVGRLASADPDAIPWAALTLAPLPSIPDPPAYDPSKESRDDFMERAESYALRVESVEHIWKETMPVPRSFLVLANQASVRERVPELLEKLEGDVHTFLLWHVCHWTWSKIILEQRPDLARVKRPPTSSARSAARRASALLGLPLRVGLRGRPRRKIAKKR